MIVNDICKTCGGLCCQGKISGKPQCKWLGKDGCFLCATHRDNACNLYPFIIVEDQRFPIKRRIFLDTACPYFQEFAKDREKIPDSYDTYSLLILEGTYRS